MRPYLKTTITTTTTTTTTNLNKNKTSFRGGRVLKLFGKNLFSWHLQKNCNQLTWCNRALYYAKWIVARAAGQKLRKQRKVIGSSKSYTLIQNNWTRFKADESAALGLSWIPAIRKTSRPNRTALKIHVSEERTKTLNFQRRCCRNLLIETLSQNPVIVHNHYSTELSAICKLRCYILNIQIKTHNSQDWISRSLIIFFNLYHIHMHSY